jgi:hypothetical protein
MDYAASLPVVGFSDERAGILSGMRVPLVESRGFVVQKLLSASECDAVVARARDEVGLKPVDWEYVASYRWCTRAVFSCPELSRALEKRLRPLLERADLDRVQPAGVGTDGVWALARRFVNLVFRVSLYEEVRWDGREGMLAVVLTLLKSQGSFFAKHRDNGFVFSDDLRSIMTLVIYLNDGFEGGKTVFSPKPEVAEAVTPVKGAGVCFPHDVRHEGEPVIAGRKWVLRTDIMFQRIEELSVLPFKSNARWVEAERKYRLSIELQKEGKPNEVRVFLVVVVVVVRF